MGESRPVTGRARIALGLVVAAIVATASWVLTRPPVPPLLDLARGPQTVYVTNPFAIGDTYTFGSTGVPPSTKTPFRITSIKVLHLVGVEVLGYGALGVDDEALGLVPDWPPPSTFEVQDPFAPGATWQGDVQALVGLRVTKPVSGLRGIEVSWVDGDGQPGTRIFDFAVVTCGPGCGHTPDGDSGPLLQDLGLLK